ncbi:MAG: hypothetical protein ACKO8I_20360 [Cyanobacteriota bacterium]
MALPPELASGPLLAAAAGPALAERITSGGATAADGDHALLTGAGAGVAPLSALLTLLVLLLSLPGNSR